MIGQINNVLCYFGKLPSWVKSKLQQVLAVACYTMEKSIVGVITDVGEGCRTVGSVM